MARRRILTGISVTRALAQYISTGDFFGWERHDRVSYKIAKPVLGVEIQARARKFRISVSNRRTNYGLIGLSVEVYTDMLTRSVNMSSGQ